MGRISTRLRTYDDDQSSVELSIETVADTAARLALTHAFAKDKIIEQSDNGSQWVLNQDGDPSEADDWKALPSAFGRWKDQGSFFGAKTITADDMNRFFQAVAGGSVTVFNPTGLSGEIGFYVAAGTLTFNTIAGVSINTDGGNLYTGEALPKGFYVLSATSNTWTIQGYMLSKKVEQSDLDAAVNALIDSAPGALDTLNELAAALGDDENFAATMTNALAGKADLSGGKLSQAQIPDSLQSPEERIAALAPTIWLSAEASHMTVDAATSEVTALTNRGSGGAIATGAKKSWYQKAGRIGRERIRLNGSQITASSPSTTKTVFHVAACDGATGARQTFFQSEPLILEYYSNNEMRITFDRDPGSTVFTNIDQHPTPHVPFIATAYADGTNGYGATFGRGKPPLYTNNAGVIGLARYLYIGDSTANVNELTGSFFEHVEFDRLLTEAEMIIIQNALAEKWSLWQFSKSPYPSRVSNELLAHRTGNNPENAISSALRVIKDGIDGWEVDTWLTSDGVNYCMHDSTVDRTTNGTGTVASKTAAQMDALILTGTASESPPSLQAFLTAVKDAKLPVMLNVKNGAGYTAANNEVNASGFDRNDLRTLLPVSNRANWVATFPEAIHYGMNDALPTNYAEALTFIAARQAEGLSGSVIEWYQLKDWHIRAGKLLGFEWFVHSRRGHPQLRESGLSGYVDFTENM